MVASKPCAANHVRPKLASKRCNRRWRHRRPVRRQCADRAGLQVTVYEQAPALGEIGAGVFITPNSVRQLQRVGPRPRGREMGRARRRRFALFPR